MEKILITGTAGFVGFHLTQELSKYNFDIVGIDTINAYYDVNLKLDRLQQLKSLSNFRFYTMSICDKDALDDLFKKEKFDYVINLAAQAGVRYSIEKPYKYIDSNLIGFINILEACRNYPVKHLIYASSSSVYGNSDQIPFSTENKTDEPVSLYAATKKANEVMAHSYSNLYKIPTSGLRFFTVYGPWGRPDMAYFSFTKNIIEGNTIKVFNHGKMKRDFTFVDDITKAIKELIYVIPQGETPYELYNIGNHNPVELGYFIETLEKLIGKEANKEYLPMQKGDVVATYADTEQLRNATGFNPNTPLEEGLKRFVDWYREYYNC
ncbi:NAD-dependent epimerase/dehydratase family protein [Plebeiibacterium sediminum]|uniref:NAD-dependent epimerase/dehydratase family protein n=1 Tax=Plebeiibacterium sediminum TaxID=2992112 RepID=A0AAE3SFR9_9BACT|nr:NAD-dependent epimerase/dehydratase family protein [Plebeiobacterium sediminum]MCW3787738.1 NAD-dependent epimerase/dehydratase family protein [Plebeiobacterium sediminum]